MNEHRDDRDAGREGLGILSTLREVLDEVITEAREKGGVSAERAREAVKGAVAKARDAAGERLDLATRQELQDLTDLVGRLEVRLGNLERGNAPDGSAGPSGPGGGASAM